MFTRRKQDKIRSERPKASSHVIEWICTKCGHPHPFSFSERFEEMKELSEVVPTADFVSRIMPQFWLFVKKMEATGLVIDVFADFDHEEAEELDPFDFVHDAIKAIERVQKSRVWFEPHSDVLDTILEAKDALQILAGYDAVTAAGGDSMSVRNKRYQPTSFDRLRLPEPSPHRTTGTRG